MIACFLNKSLQEKIKKENKFVFSVPDYYNEGEKQALLNACKIAGLQNVQLRKESFAILTFYAFQWRTELVKQS